jgi:hypothetical protein
MTPDQELVLIFGALHLLALVFGAVLFVMFLRSDTVRPWTPPDDDESGGGGGGNDRVGEVRPKPKPTGGIPLPDAEPAGVRLRGHEKLGDAQPRRERRPAREPEPQRTPARSD